MADTVHQSHPALNADPSHSTFNFGNHPVRIIVRGGAPWFVASDICAALGYANTSKAVADHLDEDERSNEQLDRTRMGSKAVIINESGLYALVLRSRKPEARKFAKWVTGEVLPSIRKTGSYARPPVDTELIKMAQAQASLVAAKVHDQVFNCIIDAQDNRDWQSERWLLAFSHRGLPEVLPVETDAIVASLKSLTQYIGRADFTVKDAEVAALASACALRIARHLAHLPAIASA